MQRNYYEIIYVLLYEGTLKHAVSLRELKIASLRGPNTVSLREPNMVSLREPNTVSLREPNAVSFRGLLSVSLRATNIKTGKANQKQYYWIMNGIQRYTQMPTYVENKHRDY